VAPTTRSASVAPKSRDVASVDRLQHRNRSQLSRGLPRRDGRLRTSAGDGYLSAGLNGKVSNR